MESLENSELTLRHEVRILQQALHSICLDCVSNDTISPSDEMLEYHGKIHRIHSVRFTGQASATARGVEVVRQSHSMAACDLENFMLAVTLKGRPSDEAVLPLRRGLAPIEGHVLATMAYGKLTSRVRNGKADDERAELLRGSRSINVRLELATRAFIHLSRVNYT